MASPYATNARRTFASTAPGGLAGTDPNLLLRGAVDPTLASAWRTVRIGHSMSDFGRHIGRALGYPLPAWKDPLSLPCLFDALSAADISSVVRLNTSVGGVPILFVLGQRTDLCTLEKMCLALAMPTFAVTTTEKMELGNVVHQARA